MELKPYQQQVINDLALFLDKLKEHQNMKDAYQDFWRTHPRSPLQPQLGTAIEPYKNNVPRVPHVCMKVPTAGGKTFIACNAIRTIFDAFNYDRPKAVLWLVPSVTILEQTLKNLKDPTHPYRQKINTLFGNKVEVFDKETLLQGSGFNASTIVEQLNIMVFSFDSLKAKKKEDRKVFQENGQLQTFEHLLDKEEEITLGAVISYLNPLVIVDESHNATTALSMDMLETVNPSFILDLTATPRDKSNIISFVDALELKRENMVKLPVIVYNHESMTDVINAALQLQRRLELQAQEEEKKGGKYIRPIVLFQAQPRNDRDNTTFEKLKKTLIDAKIPEEQIKIKTADINEIKGIDLMSRDCEVRFIITVNALKEGWDCPFAYILASLANKTSAVDVEQILGRVLRQPYVQQHNFHLLNMSYVLTASSKFSATLDNIVKGLNRAGFSDKDFKVPAEVLEEAKRVEAVQAVLQMPENKTGTEEKEDDLTEDLDVARIVVVTETSLEQISANNGTTVDKIEQIAKEEEEKLNKTIKELDEQNSFIVPADIKPLVKTYPIKEIFQEKASALRLPQFFIRVQKNEIFGISEAELLDKDNLLEGFKLSKESTAIDFDSVSSNIMKIDLDETKKEHTPTIYQADNFLREAVIKYILNPDSKEKRIKNLTNRIMSILGKMYPIDDNEIRKYITRVLEDFEDERFSDFVDREYDYIKKIKDKIVALSEKYAEKRFKDMLDTDKVFIQYNYALAESLQINDTAKDLPKTLYEKEGKINGFEERIINEIANMPNIAFWTRNIEKKGFKINGFINHYPDFIILTKNGKIIILETKGDHLDAESKISLGSLWASKAGNDYRYFMVYEKKEVSGAYTMDDFFGLIKNL